jgi:hypothetical protein
MILYLNSQEIKTLRVCEIHALYYPFKRAKIPRRSQDELETVDHAEKILGHAAKTLRESRHCLKEDIDQQKTIKIELPDATIRLYRTFLRTILEESRDGKGGKREIEIITGNKISEIEACLEKISEDPNSVI